MSDSRTAIEMRCLRSLWQLKRLLCASTTEDAETKLCRMDRKMREEEEERGMDHN